MLVWYKIRARKRKKICLQLYKSSSCKAASRLTFRFSAAVTLVYHDICLLCCQQDVFQRLNRQTYHGSAHLSSWLRFTVVVSLHLPWFHSRARYAVRPTKLYLLCVFWLRYFSNSHGYFQRGCGVHFFREPGGRASQNCIRLRSRPHAIPAAGSPLGRKEESFLCFWSWIYLLL